MAVIVENDEKFCALSTYKKILCGSVQGKPAGYCRYEAFTCPAPIRPGTTKSE
jgi:hypothetical protein